MKKNKLFMVGFVGIMMAAALLLSSCGDKENTDPKKITITDLPSGLAANVSIKLSSDSSTADVVAWGTGTSTGGKVTVDLKNNGKDWTGTGEFYVTISDIYVSKKKIEIKEAETSIVYKAENFTKQ
jgi:hypothetical protein